MPQPDRESGVLFMVINKPFLRLLRIPWSAESERKPNVFRSRRQAFAVFRAAQRAAAKKSSPSPSA